MFYSTQILARKGPLGIVWLAAHMDRQLKRQQVHEASIPGTVDVLLDPEAPLALRLSGQLLLGVVRIYVRQLAYLYQDCSDALVKMALAVQLVPAVELPAVGPGRPARAGAGRRVQAAAGGSRAAEDITLPEDAFDELEGLGAGAAHHALAMSALAPLEGLHAAMLTSLSTSLSRRLSSGSALVGGLSQGGSGSQGLFLMPPEWEEETFAPVEEDMPYDLDDIEIEKLRAAPSSTAAQRQQGGLLADLALGGPSTFPVGDGIAAAAGRWGGSPQHSGGASLRSGGSLLGQEDEGPGLRSGRTSMAELRESRPMFSPASSLGGADMLDMLPQFSGGDAFASPAFSGRDPASGAARGVRPGSGGADAGAGVSGDLFAPVPGGDDEVAGDAVMGDAAPSAAAGGDRHNEAQPEGSMLAMLSPPPGGHDEGALASPAAALRSGATQQPPGLPGHDAGQAGAHAAGGSDEGSGGHGADAVADRLADAHGVVGSAPAGPPAEVAVPAAAQAVASEAVRQLPHPGRNGAPQPRPKAVVRQKAAGGTRKPLQLDVAADGRAATALPSRNVRTLLMDRAPLLVKRGLEATRERHAKRRQVLPWEPCGGYCGWGRQLGAGDMVASITALLAVPPSGVGHGASVAGGAAELQALRSAALGAATMEQAFADGSLTAEGGEQLWGAGATPLRPTHRTPPSAPRAGLTTPPCYSVGAQPPPPLSHLATTSGAQRLQGPSALVIGASVGSAGEVQEAGSAGLTHHTSGERQRLPSSPTTSRPDTPGAPQLLPAAPTPQPVGSQQAGRPGASVSGGAPASQELPQQSSAAQRDEGGAGGVLRAPGPGPSQQGEGDSQQQDSLEDACATMVFEAPPDPWATQPRSPWLQEDTQSPGPHHDGGAPSPFHALGAWGEDGGRRSSSGALASQLQTSSSGGGSQASAAHATAFTARTQAALARLQSAALKERQGAAGSGNVLQPSQADNLPAAGKWASPFAEGKQGKVFGEPSSLAAAPRSAGVSLARMTQGATRLEAARWFFEALVLQTRGMVQLHQTHGADDIRVQVPLQT